VVLALAGVAAAKIHPAIGHARLVADRGEARCQRLGLDPRGERDQEGSRGRRCEGPFADDAEHTRLHSMRRGYGCPFAVPESISVAFYANSLRNRPNCGNYIISSLRSVKLGAFSIILVLYGFLGWSQQV